MKILDTFTKPYLSFLILKNFLKLYIMHSRILKRVDALAQIIPFYKTKEIQ